MKTIKDATNQLKPFFLDNGFFRKGNKFIKIENCFILQICFHRGCAITPAFYVIPLYYPYPTEIIPFGSNFCDYKKPYVNFHDYFQYPIDVSAISYMANKNQKSMDFDEWIFDVKNFCEKHIFPLMSQISSLHQMRTFINRGFFLVRREWSNMTPIDYHKLKAYTQFVMREYDAMHSTILEGIRAIDEYSVIADRIREQWKNELLFLNEQKNLSEQEILEWLNGIVSNTLNTWLGKNWETVIKNRLTLPLNFDNC